MSACGSTGNLSSDFPTFRLHFNSSSYKAQVPYESISMKHSSTLRKQVALGFPDGGGEHTVCHVPFRSRYNNISFNCSLSNPLR